MMLTTTTEISYHRSGDFSLSTLLRSRALATAMSSAPSKTRPSLGARSIDSLSLRVGIFIIGGAGDFFSAFGASSSGSVTVDWRGKDHDLGARAGTIPASKAALASRAPNAIGLLSTMPDAPRTGPAGDRGKETTLRTVALGDCATSGGGVEKPRLGGCGGDGAAAEAAAATGAKVNDGAGEKSFASPLGTDGFGGSSLSGLLVGTCSKSEISPAGDGWPSFFGESPTLEAREFKVEGLDRSGDSNGPLYEVYGGESGEACWTGGGLVATGVGRAAGLISGVIVLLPLADSLTSSSSPPLSAIESLLGERTRPLPPAFSTLGLGLFRAIDMVRAPPVSRRPLGDLGSSSSPLLPLMLPKLGRVVGLRLDRALFSAVPEIA